METPQLKPLTQLLKIGAKPDELTGAISPPIYPTSTFEQETPGQFKCSDYARSSHPTRNRLQELYAFIEGASHALSVSSGMAAETVILHSIPTGSRILVSDQCYGGSYRIITTLFKEIHQFDFANFTDLENIHTIFGKSSYDYIWIESPSNPLLDVLDIEAISKIAQANGVRIIIDNTFATPYLQKPLSLGAHLVFHSATKYLNGHSDLIAGAIMTSDDKWYETLAFAESTIGTTQSSFDSWLILRGIKTLGLRMEQHSKNATKIAAWLEEHPKIEKTIYPGLESHPQHTIAKKQMKSFGGMIVFYPKATQEETSRMLQRLNLFTLAVSMGGIESLVDQSFLMTHGSMAEERKLKLGILPNLVRLSVGIEDADDLINDLQQALETI